MRREEKPPTQDDFKDPRKFPLQRNQVANALPNNIVYTGDRRDNFVSRDHERGYYLNEAYRITVENQDYPNNAVYRFSPIQQEDRINGKYFQGTSNAVGTAANNHLFLVQRERAANVHPATREKTVNNYSYPNPKDNHLTIRNIPSPRVGTSKDSEKPIHEIPAVSARKKNFQTSPKSKPFSERLQAVTSVIKNELPGTSQGAGALLVSDEIHSKTSYIPIKLEPQQPVKVETKETQCDGGGLIDFGEDLQKELEHDLRSLLLFLVPLRTRNAASGRDTAAIRGVTRHNQTATRDRQTNTSRRTRPRNRRRRGRSNSRQRQQSRVTPSSSAETMYDVEDVEYEPITEFDVARCGRKIDWRLSPKYELTSIEVKRQEAELYRTFAGEEPHEDTGPSQPGEPSCCVCYENRATRVVIPCGHLCLCYECAKNIALNRMLFYGSRVAKLCPICQAAIAIMPKLV